MSDVRDTVRRRLFLRLTRKYGYPACLLCMKTLNASYHHMHEAIISRGQGVGLPDDVLFSEENCVLLHPECHRRAEEYTEDNKVIIARKIALIGSQGVTEWLDRVAEFSERIAQEAKWRVESVKEKREQYGSQGREE